MIIDSRVYFIHIPRTGGRYVRKLLSNNFVTKYQDALRQVKNEPLIHSHWHYPLYLIRKKEMKDNSKFFTVIRDPFEKIMSQLKIEFQRNKNLFNLLKDKYFFFDYVEEQRNSLSFHNNWYRPQIDFVSKDTFVWHFSLGFENEFFSWLEKNFKLKIENKEKQDYEKFSEIDDPLTISSDLTAIKKNTYLYYEKDYLLSNSVLDKLKEEGQ